MTLATSIVGSNIQANLTGYTRFEITVRKIKGYGFDQAEPRRVMNLNADNRFVVSLSYEKIAEYLDANCARGNRP